MGDRLEDSSLLNFNKICRTCLDCPKDENFASIFNVQYNENSLIEILSVCTGILIDQDDIMPILICTKCIAEAIRSYDFKLQCKQSEAKLKQLLQFRSKVKESTSISCEHHIKVETEQNYSDGNNSDVSCAPNIDNVIDKVQKKSKLRRKRKPPYECCSETFDTYSKYLTHRKQKRHSRPRNHDCTYCKKSFTYSHLQQHLRTHTLEKPFKCKICQQRFSLNGNLRRHMMTHTGERPHKCKECGSGFIQATSLAEHMKVHTKEQNKEAVRCKEVPFTCNYCGKKFRKSVGLGIHVKLRHLKDGGDKFERRKYQCDTCERTFATKTVLNTHMLMHSDKQYLCSHCGKAFARRAGLQSHSKVHTGAKPYGCHVCDKKFSQLGSMKSHLLIHSGEKPFACDYCARAFTQKNHLKYHLRTHSGEKPYECSVCGKRFAINGTLTVHMRTHTGETPFVCPVCGKGFYDSSSMKKHKKGHGEVELSDRVEREKEAATSEQMLLF